MLYLDYGRKNGQWLPNRYGGKENLDALAFLRRVNEQVYGAYPDVMMLAEESGYAPRAGRDFPEPAWKSFPEFADAIHPRQRTFKG